MQTIKNILFAFLIVSLVGCEDFFSTTLTIDPPEHVESLVVHAYGDTRSNELKVRVSKSVGLLEDSYDDSLTIENAVIELIKDGVSYPVPYKEQNEFGFNYLMESGNHIFEKGSTYELRVNAPGFQEATASATVPNDISLSSLEFDPTNLSIDGGDYKSIVAVFTDPADQKNFYEAGGLLSAEYWGEQGFEMIYTDYFDPIIEYGIGNLIFKDESFDGLEKSIRFYLPSYELDQYPGIEDFLYLNWRVTSEDNHRYVRSVEMQLISNDNPFASPVQIFSNVEGGFGIFSIINEHYLKVN